MVLLEASERAKFHVTSAALQFHHVPNDVSLPLSGECHNIQIHYELTEATEF
jgi:hypothetical protein